MTRQEKKRRAYIGGAIRDLRRAANLSQAELAQAVGYKDRSSIAKLETGEAACTIAALYALAAALHTTPPQPSPPTRKEVNNHGAQKKAGNATTSPAEEFVD